MRLQRAGTCLELQSGQPLELAIVLLDFHAHDVILKRDGMVVENARAQREEAAERREVPVDPALAFVRPVRVGGRRVRQDGDRCGRRLVAFEAPPVHHCISLPQLICANGRCESTLFLALALRLLSSMRAFIFMTDRPRAACDALCTQSSGA